MASLVICMLLSGIIFYYLRTRISMLEQSVMDQAQLLQQVVTSLKTVQYRQMNANANANASAVTAHQQQNGQEGQEGQQEGQQGQEGQNQMNLIQVSDDGESSDSDSSDTDSDSGDSDSDFDSQNKTCALEGGSCKIIDLSSISSSANYLKPASHSEIKVIELTSNIHSSGHEYVSDDDGSDDDGSDDDVSDDDVSDDDHENDDENDDENVNDDENDDGKQNNNSITETDNVNVGVKKMKSIIIEDPTSLVSLDEMKNMPVNSLRTLAKNKLSNSIDVPTINKMSKKDILKALHE